MTGRRKRLIVVVAVLCAVAAICAYLTSSRDRPQTTVVVKPGKAGSLVAVLSITNDTGRDFTVFAMLQTQEGSIWCEADEQPLRSGRNAILAKGRALQVEVELPAVARTYRFRCGYSPDNSNFQRVLTKLWNLRLPGAVGELNRKAVGLLWPRPKLFVTVPFQTWQLAQVKPRRASASIMSSSEPREQIQYSEAYREYYPTRGRRFELDGFEIEPPVVVWDAGHHRKITIVRLQAGKLGDYERCLITISGEGLDQPRFLSLCDFRHVKTSWITEKLILIQLYLGRIAAVEAIYDVEEDRFVYRQSLSYVWPTGPALPAGPVLPSQPPPVTAVVAPEPAPSDLLVTVQAPLHSIGAAPPAFLTKEVQDGMTYEIGVYVVQAGDNVTAIAHRLHLTLKDLKELNPELSNDSIQVGQQLRVYEKPVR